jgi:tetratricopeptide (TPR) repeat protein
MAKNNGNAADNQDPAKRPSDSNPTAKVNYGLPPELFTLQADSKQPLQDPAQQSPTPSENNGLNTDQFLTAPIYKHRFSATQKLLAGAIVLVALMLLYVLLTFLLKPAAKTLPIPINAKIPPAQTPITQQQQLSLQPATDQMSQQSLFETPSSSLSLQAAETSFQKGDYGRAYRNYNFLNQNLPADDKKEPVRDFLKFRMALCVKHAAVELKKQQADAANEQAAQLFKDLLQSRSPLVKALANYQLALIAMDQKQYLSTRAKAYQAIALLDLIAFHTDWISSLRRDCYFLVAESMTRNVLALCDADKDLPDKLSADCPLADPFINLEEDGLVNFLNSGSAKLTAALLGPQIQKVEDKGDAPCWSALCYSASIEELLARFATNAGLDIRWDYTPDSGAARKRIVSLYLDHVTTPQLLTIAAGSVGLLANPADDKTVAVLDPQDYSSLTTHLSLFGTEAVSLWQKFLLSFHDDTRLHVAHFATGLLKAQKGYFAEALAEYKLVANHFPQSSLAPFALLRSSRLKATLRDYSGARDDLKQLVEQYPDTNVAADSYLYLADATMKTEDYEEAARLYRKIYNLDMSSQSRAAAAFGAARCFHEQKDHQTAAEWLTKYITIADKTTAADLPLAYSLLGKTYVALGKHQLACDAFQYALAAGPEQLPTDKYLDALTALIQSHIQQGNFVEALEILENTPAWHFSNKDSIELLLLKNRILRMMGMVDKCITTLTERADYLNDPQLNAKISLELAKCYVAKGNLDLARKTLTKSLAAVEPGPLANDVAFELADVCLKLHLPDQTISVCSKLLDSAPSEQVKQNTLQLLAAAFDQQKNYEMAALVLLGQWCKAQNSAEATTIITPLVKNDPAKHLP